MIWGWYSYVEWRQHHRIYKNSLFGGISGFLLFSLIVVPPISASPIHHVTSPEPYFVCDHSDNWEHVGLRRKDFTHLFRQDLTSFRLVEASSLNTQESGNQCKSCYTIWKNNVELARREIIAQGCLLSHEGCDIYSCETLNDDKNSKNDAFHGTQMSHETHPNLEKKSTSINLNFCCCSHPSDNCNQVKETLSPKNMHSSATDYISNLDMLGRMNTSGYVDDTLEFGTNLSFSESDQKHILVYALSIFAFVLIIFAAVICIVRYLGFDQKLISIRKNDLENATRVNKDKKMMKELSSSCPAIPDDLMKSSSIKLPSDLSDIRLSSEVGEGRFEYALYKAILGSKPVVVKSYPLSRKQDYFNEREVYELMTQKSQQDFVTNFLICYGSGEDFTSKDGVTVRNFVVLESSENGYLSDFLGRMTISWSDLCKMLSSISQGLSYLHGFGRLKEPSLCHRNISGSNILVKRDLSCCLCNFNHVVVTNSSGQPFLLSKYSSTHDYVQNAETEEDIVNLIVGTPRYLAPEVLDRAINLQQIGEVSLRQIDVYAMGLVFWELSRRCRDLYQGVSVPNYELAFGQELGSQRLIPTVEQMQILVSRYRARPLFPEVWKNSNPAIQRLRETIEDSWDQDGEARLTAFCIVERVHGLNGLWERYKKSSSVYSNGTTNGQTNILPNNNNMQTMATLDCRSEREELSTSSAINRPQTFHSNQLNIGRPKNAQGLGKNISTKETKNSNVLSRQQTIAQIQPHQGRNPCMERNIMSASDSRGGGESSPLLFIQGSAKDIPIQTGPRNQTLQFSEYDELMADPSLVTFSMARQGQTTPQPIQLNVQNNFGGQDDESSPSKVLGSEKKESRKIKLNSLWRKRQKVMSKEQINVAAIPKPKPNVNLKWEKEYQAARMARSQEENDDGMEN